MRTIPKPQEIYRHFKGNIYQIITLGEHSETGEVMVVYQALYGEYKVYIRSLSMFLEKVDKTKYPDIIQEYRFERLSISRQEDTCASTGEAVAKADGNVKGADNTQEPQEDVPAIDSMVLEFLDADTYREKLQILAALHHRITDQMITTMAIASDIEINDGDLETRYEALRNCLQTLEKYECNRLR